MQCFSLWGLLLALSLVTNTFKPTNALKPPPTVIVNKCCRVGEQLNADKKCVVGATEKWWPHIVMIQKQNYFKPRGDAPRFFKIEEQQMPSCARPEVFTGDSRMALFSNGSLFLMERSRLVEPDHYCVDKDIAVVCLPQMQGADSLTAPIALTQLRKCCGQSLVYDTDANGCVPLHHTHELYAKKLIGNTTAIDLLYGFPACESKSNHYANQGPFREDNLEVSTGSLILGSGRRVQSNEFCLEHTVSDMDKAYVSVFMCANNVASVPEAMPAPKEVK